MYGVFAEFALLLLMAQETGAPLTLLHLLPSVALQYLRQWLGAGHAMEQQFRDEAQSQDVNTSRSVLDEISRETGVLVSRVSAE